MTDKLKCPFCGTELLSDPEYLHSEHFHCENPECIFPSGVELHSSVWNKIIDGKKAQDALLFISNIRGAGLSYQDMFLDVQAIAKYVSGRTQDLVLVGRYTQDELNGIIPITKQDK